MRSIPWTVPAVLAMPLAIGIAQVGGRLPFDASYPDAEMLTGAVIARDALWGGAISNWVLPEATYLFPDWGIWGGLEVAGFDPSRAVWVFGIVQLVLLFGAWLGLAAYGSGGIRHPGVVWGPGLLLLLVLLDERPLSFALVGSWRFGTVVNTAFALLLTVVLLSARKKTAPVAAAGLFAVVLLAHISDESILAWFSLPAGVAVVVLLRTGQASVRAATLWLSAVVLGHAAAFALEPSLGMPLESYQAGIDPSVIGSRLREFAGVYNFLLASSPVSAALAATGFVVVTLRLRSASSRSQGSVVEVLLAVHLVVAAIVAITVQLLLSGPSPLGPRMITHLFVFSVLYLGYAASDLVQTARRDWPTVNRLAPAAMVGGLVLVASALTPQADSGLGLGAAGPETGCVVTALRDAGVSSGIASWASQNTILYYGDQPDLQISNYGATEDGHLRPTDWPVNKTWQADQYQFALADTFPPADVGPGSVLTRAHIVNAVGEPDYEIDCQRWVVLIYGEQGLRPRNSGSFMN